MWPDIQQWLFLHLRFAWSYSADILFRPVCVVGKIYVRILFRCLIAYLWVIFQYDSKFMSVLWKICVKDKNGSLQKI